MREDGRGNGAQCILNSVSPLCNCLPDGCVSGRVEEAIALHVCTHLFALSTASVSSLCTCLPDDCASGRVEEAMALHVCTHLLAL